MLLQKYNQAAHVSCDTCPPYSCWCCVSDCCDTLPCRQDEELVDDLIKRKRAEKQNFRDKNFPDRDDLEVYRCWDSDEWDTENRVAEEVTCELQGEWTPEQTKIIAGSMPKPDEVMCEAVTVNHEPPPKNSRGKRAKAVPEQGGPGSAPAVGGVPASGAGAVGGDIKSARQAAGATIKQIGHLLIDVSSWKTRLESAGVPTHVVDAYNQTSARWSTELHTLRADLEAVMITAVNKNAPADLLAEVKQVRRSDIMLLGVWVFVLVHSNYICTHDTDEAKDTIARFNTESTSVKRLAAPSGKSRNKAQP
jgi:hypothetical protein